VAKENQSPIDVLIFTTFILYIFSIPSTATVQNTLPWWRSSPSKWARAPALEKGRFLVTLLCELMEEKRVIQ